MPQVRYDQTPPEAALGVLFDQHPAPWIVGYTHHGDGLVEDADGDLVTTFDALEACECDFHRGIVAAVNTAHGVLTRVGANHAR